MGSDAGLSDAQLESLEEHGSASVYDPIQRAALAAADEMTIGNQGLTDATFARLQEHFTEDAIVELLGVIAWENASSRFNRALRIESQRLWNRS